MTSALIAQHADEAEQYASEAMLDARHYPIALCLSLIQVESNGNPRAHRPGSQFYGVLQMGRYAGIDVGLTDRGRKTTSMLHGNADLAIRLWLEYMFRYQDRWVYDSEASLVARASVLWKGGAGTARRIRDAQRGGMSFWAAVRWIETHPDKRKRIPRLGIYIRRAERAWAVWEPWVRDHYVREAVTPGPEPGVGLGEVIQIGARLARALLGAA